MRWNGIPLRNRRAITRMRDAGRIVAETFELIREHVKPGAVLYDLDQVAERYIKKQRAAPLYKGYRGNPPNHPPFPGVICASVNEEICHGLPDQRVLKEGDVIGVDIGLRYKGYCGDACVTFPVGQVSPEVQKLLEIGQECLRIGIVAAQPKRLINAIGASIETYAKSQGVSVVREWGGHGVGKTLHEPPSVSHVLEDIIGPRLRPGMTFTIEPMINAGTHQWKMLEDGWTVVTKDRALSVQFEHTLVITPKGPKILTQL